MRRLPSEKYHPDSLAEKVQKSGGSVMIWGCLSGKGKGELHFIDGIVNSDEYIGVIKNYIQLFLCTDYFENNI